LLSRYNSSQTKERAEKARAGKRGNIKKVIESTETKKYILTVCRNGGKHEATAEEFKTFLENNKELAVYFSDPNTLKDLKMPEVPPSVVIYDHWDKAARKIITHLWKLNGAHNFHAPVDTVALQIPDYLTIIKKPMDLGTIKKKLAMCEYKKCKEFVDDVKLVFNNTILYNGESSEFGHLGKKMMSEFENQCRDLYLAYYM